MSSKIVRMLKHSSKQSARKKERGASLVLVSGALVAFVAIAALAVDYGQLVSERRAMVTATDAASLAAATVFATNGDTDDAVGCSEALSYMNAHAPDHDNFKCNYDRVRGIVEVSSSRTIPFGFGSVLGISSGTAHSSTASELRSAAPLPGVRPFAVCDKADATNLTEPIISWLAHRSTDLIVTLPIDQDTNPDPCDVDGSVTANWGIADLDGGSNANPDTKIWIRDGDPDTIHLAATADIDQPCPSPPVAEDGCYYGDPGRIARNLDTNPDPVISNLKRDQVKFRMPIFSVAAESGQRAVLRFYTFVTAQVEEFKPTGQDPYVEFRFVAETGVEPPPPSVRICGATISECSGG